MQTYMNVTASLNWSRPPVGIIRVETELAKHLLSIKGTKLFRLCAYDLDSRRFRSVNTKSYLRHLRILENQDPHKYPHEIYGGEVEFSSSTMLLTAGMDWDLNFTDYLLDLKANFHVRIVSCCYDIIPILYPQYCVADVAQFFAQYFLGIAAASDHIICISESSKKDLTEFLTNSGCPFLPPMSVFRLGDSVANAVKSNPTHSLLPSAVIEDGYILLVSTIERRKNHQNAYLALRKIIVEQLVDTVVPHLVFVGMKGWGVDELFRDISLDPIVQGRIHILSHVSNQELSWLYSNCMFSIYPSFYEGWGLPVAESLAHGKAVLCSSNSSIPEVAGQFGIYIDTYSASDLAANIAELINNKYSLKLLETEIKTQYLPRSWVNTAFDVSNVLQQLSEQSQSQSMITHVEGLSRWKSPESHPLSIYGYLISPATRNKSFLCKVQGFSSSNLVLRIQATTAFEAQAIVEVRLSSKNKLIHRVSNKLHLCNIPNSGDRQDHSLNLGFVSCTSETDDIDVSVNIDNVSSPFYLQGLSIYSDQGSNFKRSQVTIAQSDTEDVDEIIEAFNVASSSGKGVDGAINMLKAGTSIMPPALLKDKINVLNDILDKSSGDT